MELSVNEAERLSALLSYDLLDTGSEEVFDRFTNLAAHVFKAPIALISLVDRDRQWFKSAVGLSAKQTPRDQSFCAHAIKDVKVFTIADATKDARFEANPLVTGDPKIRFYAGAPLVTQDAFGLGTICIIDRVPRPLLNASQEKILADLAFLIMHELDNRKALREFRRTR
ncbi:GAF domain-containing protein [Magnetospirillum sp. SS-4]|uniref:GAF domain-containing protein n=1 Tax=Magnetospirillum sp. SS-4 TaxID=2681465 RepID=UPI001381AEEE